jgi:putative heme-binding domain-containing protein
VLQGVEASARERKVRPADSFIAPAFKAMNGRMPLSAFRSRLAGLWKVESERPALQAVAQTPDVFGLDECRSAFEGLLLLGGERTKTFLSDTAASGPPASRPLAIAALAGVDLAAAGRRAAEFLAAAKPGDDQTELFTAFVSRKGGATALARAIGGKTITPDVAKVGLRVLRASTQNVPELVGALTKSGNLAAGGKEPTAEDVRAYVADVLKSGNAASGESVFRRKELQCLACHGIGGAGGQVGPDLTSIGASAQADYLVESILLPNKAVKEGYHAIQVNTLDGKQFSGIKTRETDKVLVLRTSEDKELTVPKADLDGQPKQSRSLMPDGLADPLTRQEFVDLIRFLSELGKLGPYAPTKARVIRRWQVIEPTGANLDLFRRVRVSAVAESAAQFAWTPAYSRVSGDLPLAELPRFVVWSGTAPQSVVRCQLDASIGGPVRLKLNSWAGVTLYAGTATVEPKNELTLEVKPGPNVLTFIFDRSKRTDDIRVELEDVPGSPARVAIVGGK